MTTWFLPIFFVLFIIFTLISEPNRKNVQTYEMCIRDRVLVVNRSRLYRGSRWNEPQ